MLLRVLVTSATGYIGSRHIPVLLENGSHVVAAMRDPRKRDRFAWSDRVEVAEFDLDDPRKRSLTERIEDGTEASGDPQAAADTDPAWAGGTVVYDSSGNRHHRPDGLLAKMMLR